VDLLAEDRVAVNQVADYPAVDPEEDSQVVESHVLIIRVARESVGIAATKKGM
jgi:hypothetical protein